MGGKAQSNFFCQRDMLLTMAQVRELIAKKDQAGHGLANHS